LPNMSLALLPELPGGRHQAIVEKAVHPTKDMIALSVLVDNMEPAVAFYEGRTFEYRKTFVVPAALRVQFGGGEDSLLVSYQLSGATSTLAELDWRGGAYRNLGRYPGFDLVGARSQGERTVLLARHVSKDVWAYDAAGRHRLTSDGENYSAAVSPKGELLLSKRDANGNLSIWMQGSVGPGKRLTKGPSDILPEVSPDGRWWAYADLSQKSIMLCSMDGGSCRTLSRDERWPTWPKFSPDGAKIAYVTQVNGPRLTVVSTNDGQIQQSWDAYRQCPPVWSSATTIWIFEALAGHNIWAERDTTTGRKTGKQIEVPPQDVSLSEFQCGSENVTPDSPFFQRLRVETEEKTRLLSLPAALWKGRLAATL
jgi:hypothetical protein